MLDSVRLASWLEQVFGRRVAISHVALMSGGAIQQNWRVDASVASIPQEWVIRTNAPSSLRVSRTRAQEFALLEVARIAGVTVPEPLALCEDPSVIGRPFFVMRRVSGTAAGRTIVRSETLGGGRARLIALLGRELARIHSIRPPQARLPFLPNDPRPATERFVAVQRAALDDAREPNPILEWGLRHLERQGMRAVDPVLCHNDFRTGNLMVTDDGVTGVLDWEFADWGDPHEDVGWFCAKCWRFGSTHEAGGIGSRDAFYAAYEAESGHTIDRDRVASWELAATIRWAVIALGQAERHHSGAERSLELALTGHIVPELELDVLRMTGDA